MRDGACAGQTRYPQGINVNEDRYTRCKGRRIVLSKIWRLSQNGSNHVARSFCAPDPKVLGGEGRIAECVMMKIIEFTRAFQGPAEELIHENLARRFGVLDRSKNPDLVDIEASYSGGTFLLAVDAGILCGTGAFLTIGTESVQMVRMHIHPAYRRRGVASSLLSSLENAALGRRRTSAVLETNDDWYDAIAFYKAKGYQETRRRGGEIHFIKQLVG